MACGRILKRFNSINEATVGMPLPCSMPVTSSSATMTAASYTTQPSCVQSFPSTSAMTCHGCVASTRDRLEQAYRHLRGLWGGGPATDLSVGFRWHTKHFKYLLLGMLKTGDLESEALLSQSEVSDCNPGLR